jgi:hypothetical protein
VIRPHPGAGVRIGVAVFQDPMAHGGSMPEVVRAHARARRLVRAHVAQPSGS